MKKYLILGFALLMLSARLPAQNRVTATLSAAGANCLITNVCQILPITPQVGGVTLTVNANASSNTLQFEATADGGVSWVALNATPSNSTTAATSTTSTGTWQANVAGYTAVRIRMSSLVSGTSTVVISTSTASARSGGGGGGGGSVVSCTTTGGVAFENGTNNTLTCGAALTWVPGAGNPAGFGAINTVANTGTGPVLGSGGIADWTVNSPNTTNADEIGNQGVADAHGSGHFTGIVAGMTGTTSFDGTGTVDELAGNAVEPNDNSGGGTVTLSVGYDCGDQHGVSGVRNACFYAPDQGTGANDYAMYLAGGKLHSVGPIDSNGSVSANSDGVHAGEVALLGQTTAPTIPANSFGFIGPNSASFTSWFIQPTSTAPAAQCIVSLAAASSNISALTCPTTVPVANGGTALATLTAHALYVGNGASAPNAVSVGATGTVLAGSTGADPAFTATPAVTSISTGTSPPTCTIGTAGTFCANEGTAATSASGVDQFYADSTNHNWMASQNAASGGTNASGGATFFPVQINYLSTYTLSNTLTATDSVALCNKATAITLTLPVTGIPIGKSYRIKEIGAGACTITPSSGNLDGATTLVLSQLYSAIDVVWDGTQWWIF